MSQLRFFPRLTGAVVVLLGGLTLIGWTFDVGILKTAFPGLISMKANTAICFALAGCSLMLQASEPVPSPRLRLARIMAIVIVIAGGLTLAEYVLGLDLGLDELLFRESSKEPGIAFPGRMSLATSLNFVLIGAGLAGLDVAWRRTGQWPAQYFALAAAVVTLLAFIGYFYGVETPYRIGQYFSIALHSVPAFWLLCLGLLFARPQRGLMAEFIGDNLGGMLARRMLPAAILVPLLAGWLRVVGQRAGLYGLGFGSALSTTLLIITFAGLVVWAARLLNRADAERRQGAEALRQSNARMDGIISSAMDAVISIDAQHQIVLFNPAAEKMFGVPATEAIGQELERFIPEHLRGSHAGQIEDFARTGSNSRQMGTLGAVQARRANGEQFPAEASISQVEVSGEKLYTVILRDITERLRTETGLLESERREHARRVELEALMESAPVIVWIAHDAQCRRITGNRAAQEMLRVSPGANVSKTAPLPDRPQHFQIFKDGLVLPDEALPMQVAGREGTPVLGQELEVRFSDGSSRWIYGNAVPLPKADGTVRGVVAAFVDITALKQAERELGLSQENLRGLAARLQAVREEERTRLAREIHDVLAQELTRLKIDITWMRRQLAQPADSLKNQPLKEKLASMSELTDVAIASVQKIATELRPVVLDTLGLCAAIEWQAKDFETHTGIKCAVNVPELDLRLERERSTALFRILQESLTNVARHAEATWVEVELRCEGNSVSLRVWDNGRGILPGELSDPRSVGLLGMRERAALLGGECRITSCSSGGTTVEAHLPYQKARDSESDPVRS
jgi:PAS domain S-box-containing protein